MRYLACIFVLMLAAAAPAGAQEAQPPRIESIEITGNEDISDNRLKQVMLLRASSMFNTVRFDSDIFQGDLDSIVQFYRRSGYLQAAVTDTLVQPLPENNVHLEITIAEGVMTVIDGIAFTGNSRFSADALLSVAQFVEGDPYRQTDIDNAISQILRFYADNGYLESEIDAQIRVNDAAHTAAVTFDITEREGFSIGGVRVEGLEKTTRHVVMREIEFAPGDVVNYSKLLNTQRELYLTGLFRSVYVRPVPPEAAEADSGGAAMRDILVDLVENDSGEFNVSVGYDTVERLRSRIELYNNNLRGTALKVGASGRWSVQQNTAEISLTEPRLFGTRWQTDMNVAREFREEPGYNIRRYGGRITHGRRLSGSSRINFAFRFDNNRYTNVRLSDIPDRSANTSSLKASIVYDTRNNLFNTTKGFYIELSNEIGGFFIGNVRTFTRLSATMKYFYPASNVVVLGSAIEMGIIDSQDGLSRIPLNERFYSGGSTSIRGYAYRKVGPLDARGKPVGGKIKLVWNVIEARRNLWRWLNGAVFYDIGNVWKNGDDFDIFDIRHGVGAGLRLSTPLGLARVDYGYKLDKRDYEDRTELYFSMGQAF